MKIKPMNEKEFYKCVDKICEIEGISREYFLESAENNFDSPEDGRIAGWAKFMQNDYNWTNEFTIAFAKRLEMELIKAAKPWATDETIRVSDYDKMYEKRINF